MYESFFQLATAPFSLVSDPGCIHLTPLFKDVMRQLVYGVLERRGCIALTADPGLGKTTALRALSDCLAESNAQISTISTPTITAPEFLELLMLNFGLQEISDSKARRLRALEDFLVRSDASDRVSVLIVDEAHKLSDEVLEEIRLLSNFEAGSRKLLQVVLAGQTELNDRLNQPDLWHFKQRISTRLSLRKLDRDSVDDYLRFRWKEAGGTIFPFTEDAIDAIAAWSTGVPRIINNIGHNSLLTAFSETMKIVNIEVVREACIDLQIAMPPVPRRVARPKVPPQIVEEVQEIPKVEEILKVEEIPRVDEIPLVESPVAEPVFLAPEESKRNASSLFEKWRQSDRPTRRSKTSILSLDEPA
jgi:general secretion pathway protein A